MRVFLFLRGMLYGAAIVLILTWLAGCVSSPTVPDAVPTNTVLVPVPKACVAAAELPPLPAPTPIDLAHATPDQKAAAVAVDAEAYAAYARAVARLLEKCTEHPPGDVQ